MSPPPPASPLSPVPASAVTDEWRAKVAGSLINPDTLLATDYMNHFSEVLMMIELLPDMPDMLADCMAWQPKSYQQHFLNSGLNYGALAAEAYEHVPEPLRISFEMTVAQLNAVIEITIKRVGAELAIGAEGQIRETVAACSATLRKLTDTLGGIINGATETLNQAHIDAMMSAAGGIPAPAPPDAVSQDDIDKLFG